MEKKECLFNFYFKSGLVDTDDFNNYLYIVDNAQRDYPNYEEEDAPGALICCLEYNDFYSFDGELREILREIFIEHLRFVRSLECKNVPKKRYKRIIKQVFPWETDMLLLVDITSELIRIMGINARQ